MQTPATILFIEKQEHAREAVSVLLRRSGYNVVESADDLDGIELARRCQFDLFLLNASSLESRTQLCREIRDLHPETPIFFFQAHVQPAVIAKNKKSYHSFVVETNDSVVLRNTIAEIFSESKRPDRQT